MKLNDCLGKIAFMPREQFVVLVRGELMKTVAFAEAATGGLPYMSENQKRLLCGDLVKVGLSAEYEKTEHLDAELERIVLALAGRAANIR